MVNLTPEEIQVMKDDERGGKLPPGTVAKHFKDEDERVFGAGFKRDSNGDPIEQGIGSPGNENVNHFRAMLQNEQRGINPKGTYDKAVADLWKRDPAKARKLQLPHPQKGAA